MVQSEVLPDSLKCTALNESQRKQLEEQAFQQVRQQAVEDYIAELREKAQITVNPFPRAGMVDVSIRIMLRTCLANGG